MGEAIQLALRERLPLVSTTLQVFAVIFVLSLRLFRGTALLALRPKVNRTGREISRTRPRVSSLLGLRLALLPLSPSSFVQLSPLNGTEGVTMSHRSGKVLLIPAQLPIICVTSGHSPDQRRTSWLRSSAHDGLISTRAGPQPMCCRPRRHWESWRGTSFTRQRLPTSSWNTLQPFSAHFRDPLGNLRRLFSRASTLPAERQEGSTLGCLGLLPRLRGVRPGTFLGARTDRLRHSIAPHPSCRRNHSLLSPPFLGWKGGQLLSDFLLKFIL